LRIVWPTIALLSLLVGFPTTAVALQPPAPQSASREGVAALEALLLRDGGPECDEAELQSAVRACHEKGRREAVALIDRALRDPDAATIRWRTAARAAALLPDPVLAEPLLARLEAAVATSAAPDKALLTALRAALEATRRRWLELEEERVSKGSADAALALLDHAEVTVRRAALARLVELAQRPEAPRGEPRDRVRAAALARWPDARPLPDDVGELARLAELVAVVDPVAARAQELARLFEHEQAVARRAALLPALRTFAPDLGGGDIAVVLAAALDAATLPAPVGSETAYVEALVDALRALADVRALPTLERRLAPACVPSIRTRSIAAIAEITRRSGSAESTRAVVERLAALLVNDDDPAVRFAASVGLAQLLETIVARLDPATPPAPDGAIDGDSVEVIFQAMRRALPKALSDRVLVEQCTRTLGRVPGRRAFAAEVLSDTLLSGEVPAPSREALLNGLKELAQRAGMPAILAELPRGGPSVESDAVGKAAYGALLAVLRVAVEGGSELDVELDAVDRLLALAKPVWAYWVAARLLDLLDRYDEAEPQHAIRLAYARATLAHREAGQLERGYSELEWVALQAPAATDRGAAARRLLLDFAELIGPALASDAALYGRDLLRELVDGAERSALCYRVAKLLFAAGEWQESYDWLDREVDEQSSSIEALVLKARAAARRDDPGALRDAVRLHELLLGRGGAGGGRLADDAPQRLACELALAGLLFDAGRDGDARLLLARLPSADDLPPELQAERRRIDERVGRGG